MTHFLLLVAVAIWGSTFVATKLCLELMDPLQLVASRFLLGAPVLYAVARLRGASLSLGAMHGAFLLGASVFSLHYLMQTWALVFTTATKTGWLVAVTPVTLAVLAAVWLHERITRTMGLGIACASAGIVWLVSGGRVSNLEWLSSGGDWLALASTLTWSVFTIVTRDLSRARDPVVVALVMTLPLALAGVVLPFTRSGWVPVSELTTPVLGALVFLGIGGVAVAQWFWQHGVAKLGASGAGLYLYIEPLVTTALAAPLLGEPIGSATFLGGGLILVGVFIASRKVLE